MDLSDLDDKIQWALSHDKDAKQIALNGQRFAEKHLQEEHKSCYTFLLMLELARLQGAPWTDLKNTFMNFEPLRPHNVVDKLYLY